MVFLNPSDFALKSCLVFVAFHTVLIHANVKMNFGPLRSILVSPEYHHIHHSSETRHIDKNFAVHFPILDLAFGTYYFPKGEVATVFGTILGTRDERIPEGYLQQFLYPFKK